MSQYVPPVEAIDLEYRPLIRSTINRLCEEFAGKFGPETVERFVWESVVALQDSRVKNFIPLIAERYARDRLWSLARVAGKIEAMQPMVLFLCVHNAGRSQMAAAWMKALAGDRVKVMSGGSAPADDLNESVVAVMAEREIDIREQFPKPWTEEVVQAADVVVTMGCGDACPLYPGKLYEDWEVTDPAGLDLEAVRAIRNDIEQRVRVLLARLGIVPGL